MIQTQNYTFTVPANASYQLAVGGSFFKVTAASGILKITAPGIALNGIQAGQGLRGPKFDGLLFTDKSGANNIVTVMVGDAEFLDSMSGSVAVTANKVPQFTNVQPNKVTVTSVSGNYLSVNPNRQYLSIQNQDAIGTIYIRIGNAVALGIGKRLLPGESWESGAGVSTFGVYLIGDIASNPNVLIEEA